jgi:hypothetical protein
MLSGSFHVTLFQTMLTLPRGYFTSAPASAATGMAPAVREA